MTIVRTINGEKVSIELTAFELDCAYRERELHYYKEDIVNAWESVNGYREGEKECPYDDDTLTTVVEKARNYLSKCDPYWECYWSCFESAVRDWEKNNKG